MTKIIGGIEMSLPIILGAGVCKDPRHLLPYLHPDLPLGAVIAGSATLEFRPGNDPENKGVVQWPDDWTQFVERGIGLNSHGMPNSGIEEFLERFASVPLNGRPALASLAGFSAKENARLVERADREPYLAGMEINMGCGNTGKIPDAYSYENAHATLKALEYLARNGQLTKPIWIKLSPYITMTERDELAAVYPEIDFTHVPVVTEGFVEAMVRLIAQYPFVKAIVFSNTLANCRRLGSDGKPVTTPFDGKAGLSGPILKRISLELVLWSTDLLPPWSHLDLIGCGGALTGDDVADYLRNGASAVQCVSGPVWHGNPRRYFGGLIESEALQHQLVKNG
jgi:dihydroorotate dehydrogenase (fumarate)